MQSDLPEIARVCRLCLEERELQMSHILSEFIHGPLYGPKHRMVRVADRAGGMTLQGGLPRPLGALLAPPAYGLFGADGTFVEAYLHPSPPRRYAQYGFSQPQLRWARSQLRRWTKRTREVDVRQSIVDALLRYGQAMESADWREAFLTLWQALEIMTTRGDGDEPFKMAIVCKRTAAMFRKPDLIRDLVETLADTRNALVHRGRFSAHGLRTVNVLKWVVEDMIESLDSFSRRWRSPERLWIYYDYAPMHLRQLEHHGRIVNLLVRRARRKV